MFKKYTLKNGLRIIAAPQKNTQAATVLVLVGTGSKYETKEKNGISHFLEHMYFKGTKKRPSLLAVVEPLDKIGGIYNAFTSEEYTGYFAKVQASQFELALDWVSDIFLNSLLPLKEVQKEKKVVIEEINMRYDHPMEYAQVLWHKLLYGDQPAGWDIAGTKESVGRITQKDLFSYMNSQYAASNTVVCATGKINEKDILKKVQKYFSKIKTNFPRPKPQVYENQRSPQCLLFQKNTDQTHLCLGARGYNIFHPLRYAQDLLAVILGGMMSSRLFMEVRERLGLAYYIRTGVDSNTDTGYLVTQAGIDNKRTNLAISAILKEYKKISQKRVRAQELKKAKDYLKGKTALLLETSDAQAFFFAGQEILENKILEPKELFAEIDKVSVSDILKVSREIFLPENLNLSLIGPFSDENKFNKLLKL